MMSQNLDSAFHCYRAAISGFRALGRGWIVGLASRTALQPPARLAAYASSKAGLIALTRSLSAETLSAGFHVNVIVTSTVDTPANRAAMGEKHAGNWVTADDIADTTLYLCSDQARSISGAAIEVYGKA
jgi:NAD(P)-dependent dehydrogenase (short-subunit alcohol dehydrogenase family)